MLTDEQIFDILDGNAGADVLQQHTHLLTSSVVYQRYFNELATIHFDLAEMPLEKPSSDFTTNVLAALPSEKTVLVFARRKAWSTKWTYGFFGTILSVLLMAILTALLYQPSAQITLVQTNQFFEFFNGFMTSYFTQVAILLNLMVILVVFDRKVLRPYFKQRSITLS